MEPLDKLQPNEARILGVLIEKELTTPDHYPLSLNAATAGCNQKSNRNPVMDLSETEVQLQLDKLVVAGYVGRVHPATSRVERFRHNMREHLTLDNPKAAIMAELMMRGPQARGELRTRVSRMSKIDSQEELSTHVDVLIQRGLAKRVPPAPGSRSERVMQCLAPDAHELETAGGGAPSGGAPRVASAPGKVEELETRVARLERQLADLAGKLGEPLMSEGEGPA
ncbi:MAG: hypothetical protein ACI9F9_001201 [Candidatus Paceibacteria bacterium]|jgi:uncharacterized protein YceH (UPF0502 family)